MDSFCTIVNIKYLPQAQVLINSFREVYPDHRFVTLITDIETLDFKPLVGSEVLTLKSLKLDEMKIQNMRTAHSMISVVLIHSIVIYGIMMRDLARKKWPRSLKKQKTMRLILTWP